MPSTCCPTSIWCVLQAGHSAQCSPSFGPYAVDLEDGPVEGVRTGCSNCRSTSPFEPWRDGCAVCATVAELITLPRHLLYSSVAMRRGVAR